MTATLEAIFWLILFALAFDALLILALAVGAFVRGVRSENNRIGDDHIRLADDLGRSESEGVEDEDPKT